MKKNKPNQNHYTNAKHLQLLRGPPAYLLPTHQDTGMRIGSVKVRKHAGLDKESLVIERNENKIK